jgi:hypothetical protein
LAFGENFYPQLFTNYRNQYEKYNLLIDGKHDQELQQNFIIETSNLSGYNLEPFFHK